MIHRPSRAVSFLVAAWTTLWGLGPASGAVGADAAGLDDAELRFFETKIRPVLVEHCYRCHAADAKRIRGGLLLDTREGIRKGGDTGPAVVPGDPAESLLLQAIGYEDLEMPPKGKLPDAVIEDFAIWIQKGAPDPRDGASAPSAKTIDIEAGRTFWSFQPPRRSAPPPVRDTAWPRDEIDHHILARLEEKGLHPVGDADPAVLVRRVYFDLVGLPPRPDQIDAFVGDDSPDALEHLIDRLLGSPRFGERWGRHWLDVARYAESSGGGRSRIFPDAWRYRDYVIEAFNRDKPFNQFVAEQIAGDLLPGANRRQRRQQLVATGFLALGPKNLDVQDKERLRMDVVDEQIDTVGRAILGMTLGCARCHDHKFDPIPTTDYYALAGIFRGTKTLLPGNVSGFVEQPLPVDDRHQAALEAYAIRAAPLRKKIESSRSELKKLRSALTRMLDLENLPGIVVDDTQAERTGQWMDSTYHPIYVGEGYVHDGNSDKGGKTLTFRPTLPVAGRYEVRVAYTPGGNRDAAVPITVLHAEGRTRVRLDQRKTAPHHGLFRSMGRFRFAKGVSGAIIVSNEGTTNHVIADAVQLIPTEGSNPTPGLALASSDRGQNERAQAVRTEIATLEAGLKRLERELAAIDKNAPPPQPLAMSVKDEDQTGDFHVCVRGNVHSPGRPVPRGFLTVAAPGGPPAIGPNQSGRRQLADWLTQPNHPLTARVIVNRVWHHLFGAGLVRTPDNFGATGERPTHRALLDRLAVDFVEQGWSIKRLIKRIMLSRTYQLSGEIDPAARAADPANRLLWRMNRRPLEAEALRDAMLAVSGTLDRTAGGATIAESTESEFGYSFDTRRRSVYVPVFRNTLHEIFEVFDFADPNLVIGRRNRSTLPTQALYMMNSPFVMDRAREAAGRLLASPGLDRSERITLAYRRTLGRPPTEAERDLARDRLASIAKDEATDAWADLFHALFASIDFRYLK